MTRFSPTSANSGKRSAARSRKGVQAIEFRRHQFALEIPRRRAVPARMRARGLVGAEQNATALLAKIAVRPRIAHDRQLARAADQLRHRFGNHVVVQHVGDPRAVPGPAGDHVAIGAGGVHHVLATNVALVGADQPFAGLQQADAGHPGAAMDLDAQRARPGRHRAGGIGRGDMPVGHGQERRLDALGIDERVVPRDLVGTDDVGLVAGQLRDAVHLLEPMQLFVAARQPQAATAVPAYRVASQRLELRIELRAIHMQLRRIERADEMRALASRMPGRSRGQLALLDQHNVAPAFQRKVIQQPDAHDPAADDHHPRMRLHSILQFMSERSDASAKRTRPPPRRAEKRSACGFLDRSR